MPKISIVGVDGCNARGPKLFLTASTTCCTKHPRYFVSIGPSMHFLGGLARDIAGVLLDERLPCRRADLHEAKAWHPGSKETPFRSRSMIQCRWVVLRCFNGCFCVVLYPHRASPDRPHLYVVAVHMQELYPGRAEGELRHTVPASRWALSIGQRRHRDVAGYGYCICIFSPFGC